MNNENKPITGICCSCQSKHRVKIENGEIIMDEHIFPGHTFLCGGGGTAPQVIFNKDGKYIKDKSDLEKDF